MGRDARRGEVGRGNAGRDDAGRGNAGRGNAGRDNAGRGNAGRDNAGRDNAGRGDAGRGDAGSESVVSRASHQLQIVATPGLEAITAAEISELGASGVQTARGSVTCSATLELGYRACLWLRTASRVRLRVGRVRAGNAARLAAATRRLDWSPFVGRGAAVAVVATGRSTDLPSSDLVARIVHQAIAEAAGPVRQAPPATAALRVDVRLRHDVCTVSIDLSGERLDRRGYRLEPGRAPLREQIAAALLRASGWRPDEPLVDPMCGAGTLPIEAALLAARRAPGSGRAFPFERWPGFDAATWQTLLDEAADAVLPELPAPIHGSDRNAGQLGVARRNAARAGVLSAIILGRHDFATLEPPGPSGLVITNPPYGRQVTEVRTLAAIHAMIGARLTGPWRRWRAALVGTHPGLEAELGLTADRALPFLHGGLRCRLLLFEPRA